MHSHMIIICLHKHSCGSISSKSNHLPSPSTSITCAFPSKNVSQVWKHLSMPLKQHRCWPHLPLPLLFFALTHHLILSIENTSPSLLLLFSLPPQGCLPWSATPSHPLLWHIIQHQLLRMPPLVCHTFTPSALAHHPILTIEDASPGLPLFSSLPCHLTLSIKDVSPTLHPSFCHIT